MKTTRLTLLPVVIMGIVSCGPTTADPQTEHRVSKVWAKGSYEAKLLGEDLEPFNPEELVELAKHPKSDSEGRLSHLILRAGAGKDSRFRDLLDQENLRRDPALELELFAYDYSANGNQKALEQILARHTEATDLSWDSETVWVLGYIDEWNLTKKALGSRVLSGDGAGADSRYGFWLRRRLFYPHNPRFPDSYENFRREMNEQQRKAKR